MEREPYEGSSDIGRDHARDLGDEPPVLIRDSAPDVLAPIDADAPVSGHLPAPESTASAVDAPEHDWSVARGLVYPSFRPVGTQGLPLHEIDRDTLFAQATKSHSQPLVDIGPVDLPVVYTIAAGGFDIVVNGDHLLSWGIEPAELQDAAMANLAGWSATAGWTDERSGDRHLISSDTGDGFDAVRVLLPEVATYLRDQLGPGRILVGIPERHLLTAALLPPGDEELAGMFAEFIVEHSGGTDEPIDRRVFELVDGLLVTFEA